MIKNDKQYKITQTQARKFCAAIRGAVTKALLAQAELDGLQSEFDNLINQMKEYEERPWKQQSPHTTAKRI